jgi:hypothetical protein
MSEESLQFGEGNRLAAILGAPDDGVKGAPVVVFLSAGLLHRVGPSRLHVTLARELAKRGVPSLRVDLAGKGDSPARPGLDNQQSVGADYAEIRAFLDARFGDAGRMLVGLCSGADNAARLTIDDPKVVGMGLLDPICFPDPGFNTRRLIDKYTSPSRYATKLKRIVQGSGDHSDTDSDPLALRDLPTREQMKAAIEAVGARGGRVLSIFTSYALSLNYYNDEGQLGRVLEIPRYDAFCTELFWPDAEHTYRTEPHRRRLADAVLSWATSI